MCINCIGGASTSLRMAVEGCKSNGFIEGGAIMKESEYQQYLQGVPFPFNPSPKTAREVAHENCRCTPIDTCCSCKHREYLSDYVKILENRIKFLEETLMEHLDEDVGPCVQELLPEEEPEHTLVKYITRKGKRVGCVVATGRYEIGWSLCAPEDRFNKGIALGKALERAMTFQVTSDVPPSIIKDFNEMVDRAFRYFK